MKVLERNCICLKDILLTIEEVANYLGGYTIVFFKGEVIVWFIVLNVEMKIRI